jgi:hypothetical protein
MKKTFLETLNVPLSPLLLLPFHISRGKKNINLHPPSPSTVKKIRKKINLHPFPQCTLSPLP